MMKEQINTSLYLRLKSDAEKAFRSKDQITGYVRVHNHNEMGDSHTKQYHVQSVKQFKDINSAVLGCWQDGYVGRVKSYTKYYKIERDGVTTAFGHVYKLVQRETNASREVIGCFVAAYDEHYMTFEMHLPNGNIWQSTQPHLGDMTPDNAQRIFTEVAAQLIGKKGKVRSSSNSPEGLGTIKACGVDAVIANKFKRTSPEKLYAVVTCLQHGVTIPATVKESGVGKGTVERIKKELKELGKI